jgi:hypothetical protein
VTKTTYLKEFGSPYLRMKSIKVIEITKDQTKLVSGYNFKAKASNFVGVSMGCNACRRSL